jgi:hypothetical protein
MKIDPATLIAVAQDFFVRYDTATQTQARTDLALEAVGLLRAFVRGYEDEEEVQVRHYEATAHIPDDEDPF